MIVVQKGKGEKPMQSPSLHVFGEKKSFNIQLTMLHLCFSQEILLGL